MTQPMKYESNDPLSVIVDYLEKANKDELAEQVVDAFAENSNSLEQLNLIAKLYLDIRSIDKAEEFALRVLGKAGTPQELYNARGNLAKLYNNVNSPTKSLFQSNLNKIVTPDDPDTLLESVFSLYLLNRKKEAEEILRYLKSIEHTLSEQHSDIVNFNLGTYDLEKGDFIQGLKGFLFKGKSLNITSNVTLPFKFWDGGCYPGKTLVIFQDCGGIGDEMLLIRFMDDLKEFGFDPVYLTTRKDLCNIFNRCGYKTVMDLNDIPKDAMWTYYMHTPIYLNSSVDSVQRSGYLFPSDESRDKWSFIKQSEKMKIGVRWQGNSKNERDLHRKVPLDDMMKMLHELYDGQDVEYYSLQIGDGEEEIVNYPELIDISDKIKSYDDTLALLENLDLVITSCTSVLHASAIVGTKTMGLIPISAYFTWVSPIPKNRSINTSIWYNDNLRIFKQVTPKSWEEPISEMKKYLYV